MLKKTNILLLCIFLTTTCLIKAQSNQKITWMISPLSKTFYSGQKTQIHSYFFDKSGEELILDQIKYEVETGKGIVNSSNQGSVIELTPFASTTLKATLDGQLIGEIPFHIKQFPEFYLADRKGQSINTKNKISLDTQYLQVLITDNYPETYQIKHLSISQFREGRKLALKNFQSHIIDLNQFDLQEGDGIQIKIKDVVAKQTSKSVLPKADLIAFFVSDQK